MARHHPGRAQDGLCAPETRGRNSGNSGTETRNWGTDGTFSVPLFRYFPTRRSSDLILLRRWQGIILGARRTVCVPRKLGDETRETRGRKLETGGQKGRFLFRYPAKPGDRRDVFSYFCGDGKASSWARAGRFVCPGNSGTKLGKLGDGNSKLGDRRDVFCSAIPLFPYTTLFRSHTFAAMARHHPGRAQDGLCAPETRGRNSGNSGPETRNWGTEGTISVPLSRETWGQTGRFLILLRRWQGIILGARRTVCVPRKLGDETRETRGRKLETGGQTGRFLFRYSAISLHDALPISYFCGDGKASSWARAGRFVCPGNSGTK